MRPSLQLKTGQQLTMTPQLQQAIRLLQLSTLDLRQEIQQTLEANPMLELDEGAAEESTAEGEGGELTEARGLAMGEVPSAPEGINGAGAPLPSVPAASFDADDLDFEARDAKQGSLQDHLHWQLNLTPMSDGDRLIAIALIDAIDPNGMLTSSIESIHAGLIRSLDIDESEVVAVLHRIQQFDPVGVGYRDLRECLGLQLRLLESSHQGVETAGKIIDGLLPQLASHDYAHIMKTLKISEPELKAAVKIILSLNPRPGAEIAPSDPVYVIPDVLVAKHSGRWRVELNPEAAPRIRLNQRYAALANGPVSDADGTFIRDRLQEARWFIKSLQSRNETLVKVALEIVQRQRDFLEHGDEAMKPLVLHDIAEALDMHESTISRVTNQKYMHTPRGIYELKYFFSSHVDTEGGGKCSSTAIRAIIRKLVAAENPKRPLSDSKMSQILSEQGVQVARRTIAKYRESLGLAPSHERKSLF